MCIIGDSGTQEEVHDGDVDRRPAVAVLALLAGAVSGCASEPSGIEIREVDGQVLAVGTTDGAGGDASAEGTLSLSAESCWGLTLSDERFLGGGEASGIDASDLSDRCGGRDVFEALTVDTAPHG